MKDMLSHVIFCRCHAVGCHFQASARTWQSALGFIVEHVAFAHPPRQRRFQ